MIEESMRQALAPLGRENGMIDDPDALRLLDLSPIRRAVDGTLIVPPDFWRNARQAKPHVFKKGSIPGVPPDFDARKAERADADRAERAYLSDVARR